MAIYNPFGEQGFNYGNFPGPSGFTGFNSGTGGGIFDGGSFSGGTGAGGGSDTSKLFDTGDSGNPWDANSANFSNPWENANFNFTATNPSSGGNNPWDINSSSFVNPWENASFNFTAFNPSQGAGINNNPWDLNSPSFVNPWENANFNFTATNPSGPSNPWDVNSSDFVNPYEDASFNFTAINPSSGGGPFTGYSSDFQYPSYGGDGMPGADQFNFDPSFNPSLDVDPSFSFDPTLAIDPSFGFDPEISVNPDMSFDPTIDMSNIFQGFNPFEGMGDVGGMGGEGGAGGSALGYGGAGGSINFGDYGIFGKDGAFGGNPLLGQGAVAGGSGGAGGLGGEGGAGGAGGLGGAGGSATGGSAEANFIIPEQGLFGGNSLIDFGEGGLFGGQPVVDFGNDGQPLFKVVNEMQMPQLPQLPDNTTQSIGDTTIDSSVDLSGFGTEALVNFGDDGIFGGSPLIGPDAINIDMSMPGQQLPDWLKDSGIMKEMIGDVIDQRSGMPLELGDFFSGLSASMNETPDQLSNEDLDYLTGRIGQLNEVGGIVAPEDTGYGQGYSLDEFEMGDQPVLDMPEIDDFRSYLTNPLVDGVTEALGSANPFDTRMDAMLAGEDNVIDRQYEEALENINHQFGLTDNLGSPAYRQAIADLNRDRADSKIRLRSDFQQQAAATDESLRRNRLGDLSQALTQTTGLFTDEMGRQNQYQQQAIDDYYRNLAASEAAYYRPLNYEDEGMRMAMGGIGQAISPSGSAANQGLMNAANMYSGAANQSRQGANALANTLMDFGQGAYNWYTNR